MKAANKLSTQHVQFELQKMKTKLCLQVMSNSVASALSLCRHLKIEGFEDSGPTEEFLTLLNSYVEYACHFADLYYALSASTIYIIDC